MGLGWIAYDTADDIGLTSDWESAHPGEYAGEGDYENVVDISYGQQEEYFPGRFSPLEDGHVYEVLGEEMRTIAGYITFNEFRKLLDEYRSEMGDGTVFEELIEFYDCGGVFGCHVCQKLANDFEEHDMAFSDWCEKNDVPENLMREVSYIYNTIREMTAYASNGGLIIFC